MLLKTGCAQRAPAHYKGPLDHLFVIRYACFVPVLQIKSFRAQLRGVSDVKYLLFRLTKIYAWTHTFAGEPTFAGDPRYQEQTIIKQKSRPCAQGRLTYDEPRRVIFFQKLSQHFC